MLFLSRLVLNPASRQVQKELANPYELHRTIMHAFPDTLSPQERILYRLETHRQPPFLVLLVQSHLAPNWAALPQNNYLVVPPQTKTFDPSFEPGQQLAFRLLANPTKRLKSETADQPGKRVALLTSEDQQQWLLRKAQQNGFNVLSVSIVDLDHQLAHKQSSSSQQSHRITHRAIRFEGVLQVTNQQLFEQAIRNGIGSAKGFGFGLLSIAKIS